MTCINFLAAWLWKDVASWSIMRFMGCTTLGSHISKMDLYYFIHLSDLYVC